MGAFWRKDRKCWEYDFQWKKRRRRGSGFRTKRAARRAEEDAREELRQGKSSPSANPLLYDLARAYLRKLHTYHTKSWAYQAWCKVNKYFSDLLEKEAAVITTDEIEKILSPLKGKKKARTINELRKILNAIFNYGIEKGLIANNPAKKVARFPEDDSPKYIPAWDDIARVLKLAKPHQRVLLMLLKNTMARIGAAMNIAWPEVNLEERWVILKTRKRKGGGERRWKVPINDELFKALTELKRNVTSEYVFPNKSGKKRTTYPRFLARLCKKAKIKPFGYHALRHYAATTAANRRAPARSIQEILGHTQIETTNIYLHSLDESLRQTVDLLASPEIKFKKKVPTKSPPDGESKNGRTKAHVELSN